MLYKRHHEKNGVMGILAYNQKIDDRTRLSVGFSGGYKGHLRDDVFVQQKPDGVINGAQLGIPDLSGGVYFHQEDGLFAGISVPQLYRKKLFFDPTVRRISTT